MLFERLSFSNDSCKRNAQQTGALKTRPSCRRQSFASCYKPLLKTLTIVGMNINTAGKKDIKTIVFDKCFFPMTAIKITPIQIEAEYKIVKASPARSSFDPGEFDATQNLNDQ
jgi:hypothetical protein